MEIQKHTFTSRGAGRSAAPNPFLEQGHLEASFNLPEKEGYAVTVPGTMEKYTSKTRDGADGQTKVRYTGEAKDVVAKLRSGAKRLGVGVRIDVVEAKPVKGVPHLTIGFRAVPARQYNKSE